MSDDRDSRFFGPIVIFLIVLALFLFAYGLANR